MLQCMLVLGNSVKLVLPVFSWFLKSVTFVNNIIIMFNHNLYICVNQEYCIFIWKSVLIIILSVYYINTSTMYDSKAHLILFTSCTSLTYFAYN